MTVPLLQSHWNLLCAACGNLVRFLPRTLVVLLCLVAVIFPFLTALTISEGIKFQSAISVDEGTDFYVTGNAAGSSIPLPMEDLERFEALEGVARVVPRIVGRTYVVDRVITVVGLPVDAMPPPAVGLDQGETIEKSGDVLVGSSISKKYNLEPGTDFRFPIKPRKPFLVTGVFSSDCTIWSSSVIFMSIEDAADLFAMEDSVTDFLVYAEPGRAFVVDMRLQEDEKSRRFGPLSNIRVQSRQLVERYLHRGFNTRMGIFTALYTVAFALAVPALLIVSGFGWADRRREVGMLRVVGWQSSEIIEMVAWENLVLSLTGACTAFLTSFVWIRLLNGFFIAQFFIAETGVVPDFTVPSRFLPLPLFFAFLLALLLTMTGSLYNTWRFATIAPAEAIR
jgi:ABC-type lipoprotein release transport system permease subunit